MGEFLLRMVSRAVGLSSGVKPSLPYQFGWQSARQREVPTPGAGNVDPPDDYIARQSSASRHLVPHRGTPTIEEFQGSIQPSALPLVKPIREPASLIRSGLAAMVPEGDSTSPHQESRLPTAFAVDEEQPAEPQSGIRDSSKAFQPRQPALPVERADTRSIEALEASATGRQPFPTVAGTRRSEVGDAEPSVEVKIGRVEVTFDTPPQQAAARPPVPRGFDDYAPLRRYSPQAWNRWKR